MYIYTCTHAPKALYYCDAAIVMPRGCFIPGNLVKGKISVFLFHVYITNLQKKSGRFSNVSELLHRTR